MDDDLVVVIDVVVVAEGINCNIDCCFISFVGSYFCRFTLVVVELIVETVNLNSFAAFKITSLS
ncbi:hypothetical protein D3C83_252450 [compost metagenome]